MEAGSSIYAVMAEKMEPCTGPMSSPLVGSGGRGGGGGAGGGSASEK